MLSPAVVIRFRKYFSTWLEILMNRGSTTTQPKVRLSEKSAFICVQPWPLSPRVPCVAAIVMPFLWSIFGSGLSSV